MLDPDTLKRPDADPSATPPLRNLMAMTTSNRPRLYCYSGHRRAVEVLLVDFLDRGVELVSVRDWYQMAGIRGTWVTVHGHPDEVPRELSARVAAMGFIVWDLDDSNARARWGAGR